MAPEAGAPRRAAGAERPARRPTPQERVRARLAARAGPEVAARLPEGYQRLGRVLLLRLPEDLLPFGPVIGEAWREVLGAETVLAHVGPIAGEERRPVVRLLAGGPTVTTVVEHGIRWRLDAARTMFAAGNRTERQRIAAAVGVGERVADLFAGIGYFSVPIAARGRAARLVAVERNPEAFAFLEENLAPYRDGPTRIEAIRGDNRTVPLPPYGFDRILLGYLPSADGWIPRALALAAPEGAVVHLHRVADAREPLEASVAAATRLVRAAGGSVASGARAREVKPYGPGRRHVVVDLTVRPPAPPPGLGSP
ncbi:MAG: hypothetical protein QXG65_02125 [Thermoplasmata archaeon]